MRAPAAGDGQDPIRAMAEKLYLTRTAESYQELLEAAAKETCRIAGSLSASSATSWRGAMSAWLHG